MKEKIHEKPNLQLAVLVCTIVALVLAGYVAYQYWFLSNEYKILENDYSELSTQLEATEKDKFDLSELSKYQQSIIDSFQGQISSIGSTVGTLNKLSQTDKELLKKYSKVYFLNENYVPAKLAQVDGAYTFDGGGGNFLIHAEVWPRLKMLLDNARSNNLSLLIASAFRSFDIQASLKSEYKVVYGAGTANQFSADQGYSEHQLGTAVDFTTTSAGGTLSKFQADPAYKWLENNAYKFGFNKYFYDLDQREIDAYLIKLFD